MLFVAPSFAKAFELWANLYPVLPLCADQGMGCCSGSSSPRTSCLAPWRGFLRGR